MEYLITRLKPTTCVGKEFFVAPNGHDVIYLAKTTAKTNPTNPELYIETRKYMLDCFTINGFIKLAQYQGFGITQSKFDEFKKYLIDNRYDYWAMYIYTTDKLIKYFGMNLEQAIQHQMGSDRESIINMIDVKEALLFPGIKQLKFKRNK